MNTVTKTKKTSGVVFAWLSGAAAPAPKPKVSPYRQIVRPDPKEEKPEGPIIIRDNKIWRGGQS